MSTPITPIKKISMNSQQRYLQEYEKYKHIQIDKGEYHMRSNPTIKVMIMSINEAAERVLVKTLKSGNERERTLHWCRKNLVRSN
tara:strand:- start:1283 stop:1537 length:255 start_codon:yes stop_codon:yes gene_type:complete